MPRIRSLVIALLATTSAIFGANVAGRSHPNVVIILADDLGIGDVGCYGNDTIRTPAIDRLCSEGAKLSHHLTAATMCTPSRAALLTARYPQRYGMAVVGNAPPVLVHIASRAALPTTEPTIGDAFKSAGYNTHFTGKWHLGSHCEMFGSNCTGPLAHGFDSTFWLPYTLIVRSLGEYSFWETPPDAAMFITAVIIEMSIVAAVLQPGRARRACLILSLLLLCCGWLLLAQYRLHVPAWWQVSGWMDHYFNSIVMNRTRIVQQPVQLDTLNARITDNSVQFLRSQRDSDRPFLLFHSLTHVHTPIVSSPGNAGTSRHGRYGDSIEEMDQGIGELLNTLDELQLADNTIVYFTSDHGGHLESVGHDGQRTGGYNGLYKGGKAMGGMEGALRVPGIVRYPGVVPPGVVHQPTSLLDALPTLLELAQLPSVARLLPYIPAVMALDGASFASYVTGAASHPVAPRVLLHHSGYHLHAARYIAGDNIYKFHFFRPQFEPGSYQCGWGEDTFCRAWLCPLYCEDLRQSPLLYNLKDDPYEDFPIPSNSSEYRVALQHLTTWMSDHQSTFEPRSQFTPLNTILLPWLQPFDAKLIIDDMYPGLLDWFNR